MADIWNLVDGPSQGGWNDVGTAFTAIKMDVTDTASAAASLLLDLLKGGASQFSVGKNSGVSIRGSDKFLHLYNVDTANWERALFQWSGNILKFGTEKTGTGTLRQMQIAAGTTGGMIQINATPTIDFIAQGIGTIFSMAASGSQINSRLLFTGATASFPALKQLGAVLQTRLADDSAFAALQAKLTTDTAYAAGAPTATGYLTLYDSTGTAYRVPAVAA